MSVQIQIFAEVTPWTSEYIEIIFRIKIHFTMKSKKEGIRILSSTDNLGLMFIPVMLKVRRVSAFYNDKGSLKWLSVDWIIFFDVV